MLQLLTMSQRLQQVAELIGPHAKSINICIKGQEIYQAKCSTTRLLDTNGYNFWIDGVYKLNFMGTDGSYQTTTMTSQSYELDRLVEAIIQALDCDGSTFYGGGLNTYKFVKNGEWLTTNLIN
jgi:hypothetical protein